MRASPRRRLWPIVLAALAALALGGCGRAAATRGAGGGAAAHSAGGGAAQGPNGARAATAVQPKAASKPNSAAVHWQLGGSPMIPGLRERVIGRGARAVVLLWRGRKPPAAAVLFLHGWGPVAPSAYAAWLRHLAGAGRTIVYPVYQQQGTSPAVYRAAMLAGVAAAVRAFPIARSTLVAVGITTGGALAFDYAAVARSRGLPAPRAVLAVFPGRNPPGGEVPPAHLAHIPARTRLDVLAGPGDSLPEGEAQARALLRAAKRVPARRRRLLRPAGLTRSATSAADPATRRLLWRPFDRLIAQARAGATPAG